MKIKNTFKRIIALAVSLLIVISAASGAIYTFAAVSSSDYIVTTSEVTNDIISGWGESLVASVEFENTLDGGATFKTQNPGTAMVSKLTDGNVTTQLEMYNNPVQDGLLQKGYFHDYVLKDENGVDISEEVTSVRAKYLDGTVRKVRITILLKGKADVSNILVASAGGSGETAGDLSLANYAVFAANTKADLYNKNKAEFYHLYDNTSAKKKYQNYTFGEDKLVGVRFVGIEIYNPHIVWPEGHIREHGADIFYPRLNEFNVYGEIMPENVTYDDGALLTPEEKGSLTLVSSSISAKSYRNGVEYASGKNCANLIDEDLNTKVEFMQNGATTNDWAFYAKGVGGVKFTEGGQEIDVTANFTISVQPKSIVKKLVFVNSSPTTSRGNFTTEYEVYAADTEADLYKAENRLEHVINASLNKRQIIDLGEGITAKYIGFRIIEPVDPATFAHFNNTASADNYAVPRIAQFGVYGESDNEIANAEITRLTDRNIPSDIGTTLTGTNTVVDVRYYNNNQPYSTNPSNREKLYDGNATTGYDANGTGVVINEGGSAVVKNYENGYYYEVEYDLGTYDTVKKVYVAHHPDSSNMGLKAQRYEVYASNAKTSLWTEENKIAYVLTNDTVAQAINFKEAIKARYVGLRVLDTVRANTSLGANSGYLRLYEFGVYGEKGGSTLFELAEDTTTRTLPAGYSVVKRMSAKYKAPSAANAASFTPVFDTATPPSYTVLEGLTTLNAPTGVRAGQTFAKDGVIYRDGTTAYSEITYTLDGKCDISDIFVSSHSTNLWKLAYELYVSDSEDTLFSGTPIYVYDDTSANYFQHYRAAGLTAKYVGLRITAACVSDNKSDYSGYGDELFYPRLFGFGVIGTADTSSREPQEGTSLPVPTGESAVKDTSAYYYDGTERKPTGMVTPEKMYDGKLDGNTMGSNIDSPFAYKDGSTTKYYEDRYMDIILNLKGNTSLTDLYIAHHSNPDLMTKEYAIYIGDDKASLFSGAPYYVCDNNDSKQVQHYTFSGVTARYIGMRVTKAVGTAGSAADVNNCYVRLLEFNAFGTVIADPQEDWTYKKITYLTEHKFPNGLSFDGLTYLNHKNTTISPTSTWANTGSAESPGYSSDTGKMADGDFATQNMLTTLFAEYDVETGTVTDYTKGRVRYQTMMYDLKSEADLSYINIAFPASNSIWAAGDYEVYVGNDKANLFKGSPYASVDNYTVRKEQGIKPIMNVIAFDKSDSQADTARYVGIKIYNPIAVDLGEDSMTNVNASQNHIYGRIHELQIYGNYLDPEFDPTKPIEPSVPEVDWVYSDVTYLESHKFPNGLSFDGLKFLNHTSTTIVGKSKWADKDKDASTGDMSSYVKMADGDFSTQNMLGTKFAEYDPDTKVVTDYTKNRVRYQTVWYDLKSEADLSYINIAFPTTSLWAAGDYEVYIGNDKNTLFDGDPYATVDNLTKRTVEGKNVIMNIIAFDKTDSEPETARYVGIKIYNPVSGYIGAEDLTMVNSTQNHIYGRINEFQIYGNYVDPEFDPIDTSNKIVTTVEFGDLSKLSEVYGPNLLGSKNAQATLAGKSVTASHNNKLNPILDRKGEELNGKHVDFSDITSTSEYVIYFKLNKWEITQVNGFAFQGIVSDNLAYCASDYEVYVLEEKDDLATSEPVFHYTTDEYPPSIGQIVEFGKDVAPQGNWLVFKLNDPAYTASSINYLRLSLIYAWGEEAKIRAVPANIAENMPCEINFLNGSKRTPVSEKNVTPKELGYMTDSNVILGELGSKTYETNLETYGVIDTKGKDRDALEMVYNLCGDIEVDSIRVSTLIDSNTGFKTMKVYASSLLQGVYDEDSLIWTYKVKSEGIINPTKTFKKSKEFRYIRFVFEDTKDDVRIYTIDVMGMDNQKMKTRSLTSSLTTELLTVEKIDLKTDKRTFYAMNYAHLNSAINGSINDFLGFEDGEVGKHGYSLIIDLGDLKTLSKIELKFNYGYEEYWPKKLKLYVLETRQQLETQKKADATIYPQKDGKTVQELTMRPKLARYVKIDFLDFAKNEYFKTPDGSYKIASSIADVKLTGTRVKGMQRDESDERLISFVDKKTKAEISLVKLDENDIFTNVVSARLVPEKATNRQMDSLTVNKLKIANKTIYKVELLDLYGNVVEDLGGREVRVSFPVSKDERNGKALVGDASDPAQIIVTEGCPETTDVLDNASLGYVCSCIDILKNKKYNYVCGDFEIREGKDIKVALLKLTTINDKYWSEIGELEDFDVVEDEYRDESWYESIHTTDGRFVVTPLYDIFETGLRFTATDVTINNAHSDYYNVLDMAYSVDETATDLQVAVFYDMRLSRNGANVELADGAFADVAYNVPAFVYNNYTDLRAFYIADTGEVTPLWSEESDGSLTFQLEKMGKVAVVGTKIGDVDAGELIDMNSEVPVTGESRAATAAALSLMVAAAFVVTITAKRNKAENK